MSLYCCKCLGLHFNRIYLYLSLCSLLKHVLCPMLTSQTLTSITWSSGPVGLKPRPRALEIAHVLILPKRYEQPTNPMGELLLPVDNIIHAIHNGILNLTDKKIDDIKVSAYHYVKQEPLLQRYHTFVVALRKQKTPQT